jgi:hypothetical protein
MTNEVAEATPQAEQELSAETVMARFFELRELEAMTLARHKAELEPIKEEMKLIELYTKDMMNTQGLQQLGVKGMGTAFFATKDTLAIENWDLALEHIKSTGSFQFLNRALNKTAIKEYIEANGGQTPPGVRLDVWREVQFRKGK